MREYLDKPWIRRDGAVLVWLLGVSALAVVMLLYRESQVAGMSYRFMVWNLFLAWIPCGLSFMLAVVGLADQQGMRKLLWWFVAGIWLLFYPNAPYMLTDFIHLNRISFIVWDGYDQVYHRSLLAWYDLVLYAIFIGIGMVLSCISLRHIHDQLAASLGKWRSMMMLGGIILLAGYGMFLGRFLRLNSWDVRRVDMLLEQMLAQMSRQTVGFVLIFSLSIALCYGTYRVLSYTVASGKNDSQTEGADNGG